MYYSYGPVFVLLHIISWIIIVALIVWIIRLVAHGGRPPYFHRNDNKNALDILNERYAKGEINKEEYDQKKRDLMQ